MMAFYRQHYPGKGKVKCFDTFEEYCQAYLESEVIRKEAIYAQQNH